jgi:hypothetical protein
LALALAAVLCSDAHAYVFTTLTDPDARSGLSNGTYVMGVSGGTVVGYYKDINNVYHGFSYTAGGGFVPIDDPVASQAANNGTFALGIWGSYIVGGYHDATGAAHGFFYDGNAFKTIDDPLGSQTAPFGISGSTVVGSYSAASGVFRGFVIPDVTSSNVTYTPLDHPQGPQGTFPNGIDGNTVVGSYTDSGNTSHGFIYDGSNFTTVAKLLNGISGATAVGSQNDAGGTSHGYLYTNGAYTPLDEPDAATGPGRGTWVTGISGNTVVGYYRDGITTHGFTTTLAPEPSVTMLLIAVAGTLRRCRRPGKRRCATI